MSEARRVIRWTFSMAAKVVTFNDGVGGHTSAQTIAAGTYINKGETGTGTPTDLVSAFVAAWNAAYLAMYGVAGSVVGTLSADGHLTLSGAAHRIVLQTTGTTLDTAILGFVAGSITLDTGTTFTSSYQVSASWYPAADHVLDTGEQKSFAFSQTRSLLGVPDYVQHAALTDCGIKRRIAWDDVMGARMGQWLTDQATFAVEAGLTAADPNASVENLIKHVIGNGQVYLYDSDIPASHTEAGPYSVAFDDINVSAGGIAFESERQDLLQRRYSVSLELVR